MRRKRGFTLLELLMAMLLMALIGGIGLVTTSQATRSGEARGVAELVGEELRAARQRAISQGYPVAVALPGANGSVGHARSLYVLEGETRPRVTRVARYDREYPNSTLFVGVWNVGSPVTRTDPRCGANPATFSLTNWNSPHPSDPTLVFTPAGTVRSNGWPVFDGAFHLVVSEGVTYSATGAPPGVGNTSLTYYQPSTLAYPQTVTVTPSGSVSVTQGLVGDSGGVTITEAAFACPPGAAPPALAVGGSNAQPLAVTVRTDPPQTEPIAVSQNSYLSLVVEATDPDGDPLFCSWTASGPSGPGKFSSPTEGRMQWLESKGRWVCTWTWTPPAAAGLNEQYTLRYRLEDSRGGVTSALLGSAGSVWVNRGGGICFDHTTEDFDYEIGVCEPNGTGMYVATTVGDDDSHWGPAFTSNGAQIASFGYNASLAEFCSLYVLNRDGSAFHRQYDLPTDVNWFTSTPAWSADGSQIVFSDLEPTDWFYGEVSRVNAGGSANKVHLIDRGTEEDYSDPVCSPVPIGGHYRVACTCDHWDDPAGRSVIYTMRLDQANQATGSKQAISPSTSGEFYRGATFSKDGSKIIFTGNDSQLWVAPSNGSSAATKILDAIDIDYPRMAPNGHLIAFTDFAGQLWVCTDTGAHPDSGLPGTPKMVAGSIGVGGGGGTTFPTPGCNFNWSPSSDMLVYSDGTALHTVTVLGSTVSDKVISPPTHPMDDLPSWWGP